MIALSGGVVPWDVMTTWSAARRLAAEVTIGELKGGQFDWGTMTMMHRDPFVS